MSQKTFKITIEKPYYGWIQSLTTTAGVGHALTGEFDIMAGYSGYQEYTTSTSMMPNRPGFEGHLGPGAVFTKATDAGTKVNGLPLNAVTESDGTTYVILDSNRYVTLSSLSSPAVDQTLFGAIGSTAGIHGTHTNFTTVNGDVGAFPAIIGSQVAYSGGTAYAYFSWEDNTDGDVASVNATSATGTANFYTSLGGAPLTKGVPHPLFNFGDKFVYVGNGQYLNQFSPSLGTYQNQALILPPQWVVQGITQYPGFIAIIAWQQNAATEDPTKQGRAALFLWDGISGSYNFQYDIKDFFVSNVFYDGSNLYVISFGRNDTVKLKQFNGTGFDTLWESAIIGNWPGGVTNVNPAFGAMDIWLNHLVWTSSNQGNISAYGSYDPQNIPMGYHELGLLNVSNAMAKNLYENTLFVGNKSGGNYGIYFSDLTKFDTQTQFVSPFFPLPTNSSIDNVKINLSQWGVGAALDLAIIPEYNALTFNGTGQDKLNWSLTTATIGTTATYAYVSRSIKNINGFYLGIAWKHISTSNTAAIIRKVEINGFQDDDNI